MWHQRPERKHRGNHWIPLFTTKLPIIEALTICVNHRVKVFADPTLAEATVRIVNEIGEAQQTPIHACCVMPDHVHVVVEPMNVELGQWVSRFKNEVQREARRLGRPTKFWQRSFWPRRVRSERDLALKIAYVLNNPVRAGLVSDWRDYPFSCPKD